MRELVSLQWSGAINTKYRGTPVTPSRSGYFPPFPPTRPLWRRWWCGPCLCLLEDELWRKGLGCRCRAHCHSPEPAPGARQDPHKYSRRSEAFPADSKSHRKGCLFVGTTAQSLLASGARYEGLGLEAWVLTPRAFPGRRCVPLPPSPLL